MSDPARLYTSLLNTRLQQKDNPLYQVIHDLISLVIGQQKAIAPIISPGIVGPQGLQGLPGVPGFIYESSDYGENWLITPASFDRLVLQMLTVDSPTLFVDSINHRVGIGTLIPNVPLDVIGAIQGSTTIRIGDLANAISDIYLGVNTGARITLDSAGASAFTKFTLRAATGTQIARTDVSSGDTIGSFEFQGYSGGYFSGASISAAISGVFISGQAPPTEWRIATNIANTVPAIRMTVASNGFIGINVNPPDSWLHIKGSLATNGSPANSGTTAKGNVRINDPSQITMDMGTINAGAFPAWIQVHDNTNQAVNYPLCLQINGGGVGIGSQIAPTANLHLPAGTASAATAPLKLTSGTLLTLPEAGSVEFLTDKFYGTTTTGPTRKTFAFVENSSTTLASTPVTGQVAANASIASITIGASDATIKVSANVNVTAVVTCSFSVTCAYTDETNTSRTLTLPFVQLGGVTIIGTITQITGTGPYEGISLTLRCKAGTTVTLATSGASFVSVTYNVTPLIEQAA